ncbi:MAG: hypothetical protein LJE84_05830 [Gammaproteobacteria bacterium]|nr:hypothetical protein [Gammaproteobacteria bacterium]
MKKRFIRALAVPAALFVALLAGTPALADPSGEIRRDIHIQTGRDVVRLDIDTRTYREVLDFFQSGYPTASVLLHAVNLGMTINDAVYLAVKADREGAEQIYATATGMLPSLPGWACSSNRAAQGRYAPQYLLQELPPQPKIAEVARRFFKENKRLAPFPDWQLGKAHMPAQVSELEALVKKQEEQRNQEQAAPIPEKGPWWYLDAKGAQPPDSELVKRPVFVSLYKNGERIVVDNTLKQVEAARRLGLSELGAVFVYNEDYIYPVGDLGPKATVKDGASRFFGGGNEATPVPQWSNGNFHVLGKREELEQIFKIPEKKDVNEKEWKRLSEELQRDGFKKRPMLVSLLDSGRMWLDEPARVAVAKEQQMEDVPVVYFYHSSGRQACGVTAVPCQELVCDAVVAAGGDPKACEAEAIIPSLQQPLTLPDSPPGGGATSPS